MARGCLVELPRRREFGGGIDQSRHDQGQRQQARARRARRHQRGGLDPRVEAEAAGHAEHRGEVAMRQRAQDFETAGRQQLLVAQYRTQRRDFLGLPFGQVGEGAVLDLAILAKSLTQQDGGGRAAVWDDGYVHEDMLSWLNLFVNELLSFYMTTFLGYDRPTCQPLRHFPVVRPIKLGLKGASPPCRAWGYRHAGPPARDILGGAWIEASAQSTLRSFPSLPSPSGHPPPRPSDWGSSTEPSSPDRA